LLPSITNKVKSQITNFIASTENHLSNSFSELIDRFTQAFTGAEVRNIEDSLLNERNVP
jgi:hypothetical protein